jgi:uncharacterized iron-regulated membrane protein
MLVFAETLASPTPIPPPTGTLAASATPSPAAAAPADVLSGYGAWVFVGLVAFVIVVSGLVILWGRRALGPKTTTPDEPGPSLIRSWISISLVSGLLLFCGTALLISDSTLRATLFGGLIASVGAAVAFYFSTNAASEARRDVLNATLGLVVPDLVGTAAAPKTLGDAQRAMSQTALQLASEPPSAQPEFQVTDQSPRAGTIVRNGSTVTVQCKEP